MNYLTSLTSRIRSAALASELPYRAIIRAAGALLTAVLLSRAEIFGLSPFPFSLIAAADHLSLISSAVGGILGSLGSGTLLAAALSSASLVLIRIAAAAYLGGSPAPRGAWLRRTESAPVPLRCAMSAAGSLIFSGLTLPSPVTGQAIASAFLTALLSAALTAALTIARPAPGKCGDSGAAVLLFGAVRALAAASGLPFSISAVVSFTVSLIAARGWGMKHATDSARVMRGTVCGVICGVAVDAGGPPLYALAAAAAGILYSRSVSLAVVAAWISAVGIAYGAGGIAGFAAVMPEITLAAAVLIPVLPKIPMSVPTAADPSPLLRENAARTAEAEMHSRMHRLSTALDGLSARIGQLARKTACPSSSEARDICAASFDARCAACENRPVCRGRGEATYNDMLCRLALSLRQSGRADAGVVDTRLAARCHRLDDILTEAEAEYAHAARRAKELDHTDAAEADYAAFAQLIRCADEEAAAAVKPDEAASRELKQAAMERGIPVSAALVAGERRRSITLAVPDVSRLDMGNDEVREWLEDVVNAPLTEVEYAIEGGEVLLRASSRPRVGVTYASSGKSATRSPSGDAAAGFETEDGRYYAVICDGMGSGGEASVTARMSTAFLGELLSGGAGLKTALTMLNSYLCRRSVECSAGIDVMELDRYTGEAAFVKSGAAPSYVIRDGRLFRLSSRTVPIGILRALDAEMIRFTPQPGDRIVMVSDGVTEEPDDIWLCDMLASPSAPTGAQALSDAILEAAAAAAGRDDLTVVVVAVA